MLPAMPTFFPFVEGRQKSGLAEYRPFTQSDVYLEEWERALAAVQAGVERLKRMPAPLCEWKRLGEWERAAEQASRDHSFSVSAPSVKDGEQIQDASFGGALWFCVFETRFRELCDDLNTDFARAFPVVVITGTHDGKYLDRVGYVDLKLDAVPDNAVFYCNGKLEAKRFEVVETKLLDDIISNYLWRCASGWRQREKRLDERQTRDADTKRKALARALSEDDASSSREKLANSYPDNGLSSFTEDDWRLFCRACEHDGAPEHSGGMTTDDYARAVYFWFLARHIASNAPLSDFLPPRPPAWSKWLPVLVVVGAVVVVFSLLTPPRYGAGDDDTTHAPPPELTLDGAAPRVDDPITEYQLVDVRVPDGDCQAPSGKVSPVPKDERLRIVAYARSASGWELMEGWNGPTTRVSPRTGEWRLPLPDHDRWPLELKLVLTKLGPDEAPPAKPGDPALRPETRLDHVVFGQAPAEDCPEIGFTSEVDACTEFLRGQVRGLPAGDANHHVMLFLQMVEGSVDLRKARRQTADGSPEPTGEAYWVKPENAHKRTPIDPHGNWRARWNTDSDGNDGRAPITHALLVRDDAFSSDLDPDENGGLTADQFATLRGRASASAEYHRSERHIDAKCAQPKVFARTNIRKATAPRACCGELELESISLYRPEAKKYRLLVLARVERTGHQVWVPVSLDSIPIDSTETSVSVEVHTRRGLERARGYGVFLYPAQEYEQFDRWVASLSPSESPPQTLPRHVQKLFGVTAEGAPSQMNGSSAAPDLNENHWQLHYQFVEANADSPQLAKGCDETCVAY